MKSTQQSAAVAGAAVMLAGSLAACGPAAERWCEHDATDKQVADSFCERNVPGYEWEDGSDDDGFKVKKPKKSSTSKSGGSTSRSSKSGGFGSRSTSSRSSGGRR